MPDAVRHTGHNGGCSRQTRDSRTDLPPAQVTRYVKASPCQAAWARDTLPDVIGRGAQSGRQHPPTVTMAKGVQTGRTRARRTNSSLAVGVPIMRRTLPRTALSKPITSL